MARRIALLSMPWHNPYLPSIQLGTLKAYLERQLVDLTVDAFHYYFELEQIIGLETAKAVSEFGSFLGEAVFAWQLFPEKRPDILAFIEDEKKRHKDLGEIDFLDRIIDPIAVAARRRAENVEWDQYLCVGFSLVFAQTLGSVLMAKLIKERYPATVVIAGGPCCTGELGMSLLRKFPQLDFVVNGEGELPLLGLVTSLLDPDKGHPEEIPGVLSCKSPPERLPLLNQLADIESLPIPDYRSYFEAVDASITSAIVRRQTVIPVESSRGCWWDRSYRNPMLSCSFCNLNLHWKGYREKQIDNFVAELDALSNQYNVLDFLLVDNILRFNKVAELCAKIVRLKKNFRIGIEARVSVKPAEMALLRKAGVVAIQFGIEALSTEILKLINKGTTCIQNIQAMKFCDRFGIESISNLITGHPGVRAEAILETIRNLEFVTCYHPLQLSSFTLTYQSPIYKNPLAFGVRCIRNHETLSRFFPSDYWHKESWLDKSFDADLSEEINGLWNDVARVLQRWKELFATQTEQFGVPSLLIYVDGGDFLRVTDYRTTPPRVVELDKSSRRLYLACEEIINVEAIQAACNELDINDVTERLEWLVRERLVFREGKRYLSLAIPSDPVERLTYCVCDELLNTVPTIESTKKAYASRPPLPPLVARMS
ncbi:MAG TPA: RiPP maturation radical SAM C-methyltransferase [Candidatus Eremiobacteraceae bacterium]|nr:RiPP maturation radical SAM C-methyltransferase [Candidatus Eremiobacteraceae bacterium]